MAPRHRVSIGVATAGSLLAVYSWAAIGTVLCSFPGWLYPGLTWAWWGLGLVATCIAWRFLKSRGRGMPSIVPEKFEPIEWLCAAIVVCSLGGSLVMALFSAPNNGDVLIYHLPRQLIWISERTVFPDAMPYGHMHKMPPLTEWIGVQLYLLSGTDRFHFLIQWTAFAVCLVSAGGIVQAFGGARRQALLASAFFATLPAAFFQASNSKNDVFLAALVLGILWIAAIGISKKEFGFWQILTCAYLVGLAVLAKGTAFAFLPFAAASVFFAILRNWRSTMAPAIAVGLAVFALTVSPHYLARFSEIFSSETGDQSQHANAKIGPAMGASVFFRNYALQLALPIEPWNAAVQKIAAQLAEKTRVPVSDPGSTFHGAPFEVTYHPFMEDRATAILHFSLPLVILVGGCFLIQDRKLRRIAVLSAAGFMASIFLFSVLFRFQLWHSRLMIPAVAIAAPGAGIFLGAIKVRAISTALVLLMAAWLTPSFSSWARPLVGDLTVFGMDEDAAVSRAGSGASFLPSFGKTMAASGAKNVWLDLENGVVHAALRYLPLSTSYGFPRSGNAENFPARAVLSNRKQTELDEKTSEFLSGMELVSRMENWSLWLPAEASVKLESIAVANDLPPLWGCTALDGLGEWQGPYPQFNVDVFAKTESGKVRFKSTRALNSARLLFHGAPEGASIPIIISHAGSNIYSGRISKKTGSIEIPLGKIDERDIFEIQIPDADSFRIYFFRIYTKI